MTCENCEDGEHEECEDPEQTWMEWDTGAHHVQVCCCGVDEPDYEWEAEARADRILDRESYATDPF